MRVNNGVWSPYDSIKEKVTAGCGLNMLILKTTRPQSTTKKQIHLTQNQIEFWMTVKINLVELYFVANRMP